MKNRLALMPLLAALALATWTWNLQAQDQPAIDRFLRLTNKEVSLQFNTPTGYYWKATISTNLSNWTSLVSFPASTSQFLQHTDSSTVFVKDRYYWMERLPQTNQMTGDHLQTTNRDVIIRPMIHGSLGIGWGTNTIFIDRNTNNYAGMPLANLFLITHEHSDHWSASSISKYLASGGRIITTSIVSNSMPAALRSSTIVLSNGFSTNVFGMQIESIAMYTPANHAKGVGNGYVLNLADKRIYISGDTENNPETRALQNIDVAFLCMRGGTINMDTNSAAATTLAFKPRIVYPYHYLNVPSAPACYKQLVGTNYNIEVRTRKWY